MDCAQKPDLSLKKGRNSISPDFLIFIHLCLYDGPLFRSKLLLAIEKRLLVHNRVV